MLVDTNTNEMPKKMTTQPVHVGSSVIGIKYDKGVIIAGDDRINVYGYKKYINVCRIAPVNQKTIMGSSGEYSDFQELNRLLVEKTNEDDLYNGSNSFLGPKEISNYLSYICYEKRSKMDPYWNTTIIGGLDDQNKPVLYSVDQFGTKYTADYLVSGFALYFAGPIIDKHLGSSLSKQKALALLEDVFKVLFYRDASAGDRIYFGILEDVDGVPQFDLLKKKLETKWEYEMFSGHQNQKYHPTVN